VSGQREEKFLTLPELELRRLFQPVVSRYTNCANLLLFILYYKHLCNIVRETETRIMFGNNTLIVSVVSELVILFCSCIWHSPFYKGCRLLHVQVTGICCTVIEVQNVSYEAHGLADTSQSSPILYLCKILPFALGSLTCLPPEIM
jgi:hypothetical protein